MEEIYANSAFNRQTKRIVITVRHWIHITVLFLWAITSTHSLAYGKISMMSDEQWTIMQRAYSYAQNKRWSALKKISPSITNTAAQKLLLWTQYTQNPKAHNFKELTDFTNKYPHWPKADQIKKDTEYALNSSISPKTLIKYFNSHPSQTVHSKQLYANALIATNPNKYQEKISQLIRTIWTDGRYNTTAQKNFLNQYQHYLRPSDHAKRIDRLLWEHQITAASRLFHYVTDDMRKTFQARIYLIRNTRGVSKAIAAMPAHMKKDPGFLYERIRWHERRDRFDNVHKYIKNVKTTMPHQPKWWKIKNRLIREFLQSKRYNDAYHLAHYHGNEAGTPEFADSQWLAGWISLRFLAKPQTAYKHFYAMFKNVSYPISKARASYWAGRSAEANFNPQIAHNWYSVAAEYSTTFYGQLAFHKRYPGKPLVIAPYPTITQSDRAAIKNNVMVRIIYLLIDLKEYKKAEYFIKAAIDHLNDPGQIALISEIGINHGLDFLSVIAAKHAIRKNIVLTKSGYPVITDLPPSNIGHPYVLAIIRQESRFDQRAKSSAKAIGYMQLLPSTARRMAKRLRLRYSYAKLRKNGPFNIKLGTGYLDQLWRIFDQQSILSIASYNAGPTNVRRWFRTQKDIRTLDQFYDQIDWIEHIPFKETRNYVQRVLENKNVYHALLKQGPLNVSKDF